jgi:hypothetical protein
MTEKTGAELMYEYEDGMSDYVLEVSKNRRAAQDKLMQAYPRIALNRVEAHGYLMNWDTGPTPQFRTVAQNLAMEHGYNIIFNGFGFDGYFQGPMMLGGPLGQKIAKARGSLLAEGLLANESQAGAKQYCSHLYSYAEYEFGIVRIKVTNYGSPGGTIEYDPPDWEDGKPPPEYIPPLSDYDDFD